ncbi:MAG: Protein-L-isoaspartate (D-aspartate) O-methyltransferase [Candidatus Saccharibacteria bacterium]|jgi:protein-L-isoaspartate(D-aspartate) O-methyltransferase|nr:Protein-L-isoaspartate (D-aspartate) O-methyltransferase [Candidatus Saccharibacteria bacterium]
MKGIDQAFDAVSRRDFVLPQDIDIAYEDRPLSIGYSQTISQPSTVRKMLEWLDAQPGDKVLDIGSGSGWTTALLSHIVGPDGKVFAVEIIPDLVKMGEDNCKKLDLKNVTFFQAGDQIGLPEYAPYSRILVSAAAREMHEELHDQLTQGGKLVIPIQNTIFELTNTSRGWQQHTHPGFTFVPLVN